MRQQAISNLSEEQKEAMQQSLQLAKNTNSEFANSEVTAASESASSINGIIEGNFEKLGSISKVLDVNYLGRSSESTDSASLFISIISCAANE